jgi:hypothetical protein
LIPEFALGIPEIIGGRVKELKSENVTTKALGRAA